MVCISYPVLSISSSLNIVHGSQSTGMDVLDEKLNGAPPMEIDEVVSVRDRES